jgi:hypothetical protein
MSCFVLHDGTNYISVQAETLGEGPKKKFLVVAICEREAALREVRKRRLHVMLGAAAM